MSGTNWFQDWLKELPSKFQEYSRYESCPVGYQNVREISTSIYTKYPKDSTFDGKKVLNFGCGKATFSAPNVLNVDIVEAPGVIRRDPSRSLRQFGDDFDLVLANHTLEHIPNWFDCFAEMADICKVGGRIEVWIPTMSTDAAFTYRDHINYMGLGSFCGVQNLPRMATNLVGNQHRNIKNLRLIGREIQYIKEWWVLLAPDVLKNWMYNHLRNIASEEMFLFEKVSHE